jgi:integrase
MAAACRKADELRNAGTDTDVDVATVAQVVQRYLDTHRLKTRRILARECRNQRRYCAWIVAHFGTRRLRSLTTEQIASAFVELERAPSVHDYTRTVFVSVFRFAGIKDHPVQVPTRRVNYAKVGLEDEEIARLIDETRRWSSIPMRALLLCAFELAARPGELARTLWRDVDLQRGTLVIRKSKNGRDLHYDLNDRVVAMLKILHDRDRHRSDYVFTPRGPAEHIKCWRHAWKEICLRAGVRHVRAYDFIRHARASQWLAAGVSLADVSALLNHSDVGTTNRYLDSSRDRRRAAIDLPPPSMRDNDRK